jgi:tetratricopeptide (TPR) repeat protein
VYLEAGEDDEAVELYKESLRVERKALGQDHPEVAFTLRHLGQVHQERGEFAQAISYFREALAIERQSKDKKDPASISKLLNLIGDIYLMRGEVDQMMKYFVEACHVSGKDAQCLVIAGHSFYDLSKLHPPCAPTA